MGNRVPAFRRFFVSTLGLDVLARGLSALSLILFVRTLSTTGMAYIVLLQTVGQFAGSALTGGIRMRYVREEAERVSRGGAEPASFMHPLVACVALIGGVAVASLAVAELLSVGSSFSERATFIVLAFLYTTGHATIELAMYHQQAHLRFTRAGLTGVLRSGLWMAVAAISALGAITSREAVGGWMAAGTLGVALIVCLPIAWSARTSRHGVEGRLGFGPESAWLTVYYLVSAGYAYIGVFLVAALLDAEELASYGAATRYFAIVLGPVPALLAVLRVRTSQHDLVDSVRVQLDFLKSWIRRATPPVLAILAVAAAAAPWVIPLVDGGKYPDSVPVFEILLVSALFSYATMPAANLLMTQRRYRVLALLYGGQLVLTCGLGAAAGVAFGVNGIAAATSLASAAESIVLVVLTTGHIRRALATGAQPPEPPPGPSGDGAGDRRQERVTSSRSG